VVSAAPHLVGINSYQRFLAVWRPLNPLCHIIIGNLICWSFSLRGSELLGLCAALLLLLGRWSVYLVSSLQLEFATILPPSDCFVFIAPPSRDVHD